MCDVEQPCRWVLKKNPKSPQVEWEAGPGHLGTGTSWLKHRTRRGDRDKLRRGRSRQVKTAHREMRRRPPPIGSIQEIEISRIVPGG